MLKKIATLSLATFATAALVGSANAALITNGDFESQDFTGDQQDDVAFTGWSVTSGISRGDEDDFGRVPGSNPNQVVRMGSTSQGATTMYQDTSHSWDSLDIYEISFNAITTWWPGSAATMNVKLYDVDGLGTATELWSSGTVTLEEYPDTAMAAWTDGSGSSVDTLFEFNVAASTFTTGTEGNTVRIEFNREGEILWLDNASITVVPEPGSLALLGLGGLLIGARRRRVS